MWFFGKKWEKPDHTETERQDMVWREKYMDVVKALGQMYPFGMMELLAEIGETREIRWNLDDWNRTICRNEQYICENIGRLKELDRRMFNVNGHYWMDLPVPDVTIQHAARLSRLVESWPRTRTDALPYHALADYIPARTRTAAKEVWDIRKKVWHFKCDVERTSPLEHAIAMQQVIEEAADVLLRTFGDETKGLTLVCIPASSAVNNDIRYAEFAERLCRKTGMKNAQGHIRVIGTKIPKHLGRTKGVKLEIDQDWFCYRKIMFFDDIITTGGGYEFHAGLMKTARAFVIGALFIARTVDADSGRKDQ